MVGSKP